MSRSARARALGGSARRRRLSLARLVTVLVGLAIAATGIPGWTASPSVAAGTSGDGSDWGYSGISHSASAETVTWDDSDDGAGNADSSIVYRDGRQVLPHSGGATYNNIDRATQSAYFASYGKNNGFGGLKVKVSQTQDLVNQSVTLDVSGVAGGAAYGTPSSVYLQVMQCWGGLTASGKPDAGADNPDPATCQFGAGDAASQATFTVSNSRYINTDPLTQNGDWDKYFNKGGTNDVPFTAINGQKSGSTHNADNQFFNASTTNEISRLQVSANGTATRQFEIQSSLESSGLGCGKRRGVVSTNTCWLVIVPRIDGVLAANGPISPSLWAQRMQVKLGMRDIVAGCPSGQDRTLTVGSELLSAAAASWTPGLCDAKNIALGYTQLGDPVARAQYSSGAADAVLTTEPADKAAAYVPVSLSAPVIAYALSYQPNCAAKPEGYTEQAAHDCGYDSVAALNADIARSGTLVRNMHLDARLVAKLLTQSYTFSIFDQDGFRRSGWMVKNADGTSRPSSLIADPEFLRLNPDLKHISPVASGINNLDHLVLEALRSDGAAQIWDWILSDPDATAFLNGCPDANDMTINPFYSTRSYEGCESKASTLAAQADADRKATTTPVSYVDEPLSYPPDGSPYPSPGWQEADTEGNPPFGVFDFLPRVDSMPLAGRDVAIGYLPRNSALCLTVQDFSCQPAPGLWKDPKTRQAGDKLGVMAVTTSATAARFQLPTALLCNTAGTQCVGADTATLQKAASKFVKSDVAGVLKPGPTDYAAGAYPLAMPVYAGVSTSLPVRSRNAYANALEYVTTTGQKPGFAPGNLPPGYAPLTKSLRAEAVTAIAALRKGVATSKPSSTPTATPSGTQTAAAPGDQPSQAPQPQAGPSATVALTSPQFENASSDSHSFPKWPLPLGLAIAVLAAFAGPLLRLRSTIKIGWP